MNWSKKKYHTKVGWKISSAITLRKVDLSTKVDGVKTLLDNIYMVYTKLCDVDSFTHETLRQGLKLQENI